MFVDGTCGLLSLLPNMFRHYGWNPGDRAMRWFGECLAVKTGNPDITFQEVSPWTPHRNPQTQPNSTEI